jgi:hypothetical protein
LWHKCGSRREPAGSRERGSLYIFALFLYYMWQQDSNLDLAVQMRHMSAMFQGS